MSDRTRAGWRDNLVLYGALSANLGIAVAKFVAAALTGSSSMLTEGVHSLVDTLNQLLLLYGQRRAARPPDSEHPFGYGRELYFWSFVVAMLIFGLGALISVYEGYRHIVAPARLESASVAYVVLAVAAVMEAASWTLALRELAGTKGEAGWWQAVRQSKDPATFVVLFEDSAALIGLALAATGVWASHYFMDARIDGAASIGIGLLLTLVAGLLARESKGLLIGERAEPGVIAQVRAVLAATPGIERVNHVRTLHTAPDRVFVAISADFRNDMTMGEGEALIEAAEARLRAGEPRLASIYIRPEAAADAEAERARVVSGG